MAEVFIRPTSYTRPTGGPEGVGSFQGHVDRGSVNPGVDYPCPVGTLVTAVKSGVVKAARWSNLVGWYIVIYHDDGGSSDYLHNSELLVSVGSWVAQGRPVAESGRTGSVATGPHSHVSVRTGQTTSLSNVGNFDIEQSLGGTGGGGTVTRKRNPMLLFNTPNTGSDKAKYPVVYHLIGENGSRARFVSAPEFANGVAGQTGNAVGTDEAFLASICGQLAASSPAGAAGGPISDADAQKIATEVIRQLKLPGN